MASDYIPNLGSQIDRALMALFIADEAVTADQVFVVTDFRERPEPPILDIKTVSCQPVVPFTGVCECNVDLFFKFNAVVPEGDADSGSYRAAMDMFVGKACYSLFRGDYSDGMPEVCDALTQAGRALATAGTAEDQANNADMTGFTVSRVTPGMESRGFPISEEGGVDGSYWVEKRSFTILATSANTD